MFAQKWCYKCLYKTLRILKNIFISLSFSDLVNKNKIWHIFCFIVALIELIVPVLERNDSVGVRFKSD